VLWNARSSSCRTVVTNLLGLKLFQRWDFRRRAAATEVRHGPIADAAKLIRRGGGAARVDVFPERVCCQAGPETAFGQASMKAGSKRTLPRIFSRMDFGYRLMRLLAAERPARPAASIRRDAGSGRGSAVVTMA
jgi:hypothetical protein